MAPLVVDPEAMFVAGSAVDAVGEGLAAALGPLTAGFGINSGQDAAGLMFGLGYRNAAQSLLNGAAAGIFACRYLGAKVQLCASNYSRAEAASNVRGSGHMLPTPAQPQDFPPPGRPGTVGAGVAQPLLWAVVEALVDDVWPNGNGVGMHAAAGCWRGFGDALRAVGHGLDGPKSVVAGQQVPEAQLVQQVLSELGSKLEKLAGRCDDLAKALDEFANVVENAQNKIRDLLGRLAGLTNLAHDVMLIFEGDAADELEKIVRDINDVLDNMKREAQAREHVIKTGMQIIDGLVGDLKTYVRGQLVEFLGETVGKFVADDFALTADAGEGIFKSAVGIAELQDQLDPSRFAFDPKGVAASWAALDQSAFKSIPVYALFDPKGAAKNDLGVLKGLTHWDDLTSGRPGLGIGEGIFDGMTFLLGGGLAKAGSEGAEAAGAEATEEATEGEKAAQGAAGAAGELNGVGGTLADIATNGADLTKGLQNLGEDLPKGDPLPGGSAVALPPGKLPEVPVESAPHPPVQPHGPADPATVPPESPRGAGERPAPEPVGGSHEPAPGGGPREPVTAPGATAQAGHAVGDRMASAVLRLVDHSPTQLPVSPARPPFEPASAAHSPRPAPSAPSSAPPAGPHFASPSGHPAEMPAPGGGHVPNDGLPPGEHPHRKPPHEGKPDEHDDGKSGDDRNGRSDGDDGKDHASNEDASSDGISAEKRSEIIAMPKGSRPDPSEYLSPDYIKNHLQKFSDGATRFMPASNLEKYGIAQRDGTSFVMPRNEADAMLEASGGNLRSMENELGLPEGFLDSNNLVRIDIADPGEYHLRMPSGNEAGANEQWIPGGVLPDGASEAVIDGGEIPPDDYTVTNIFDQKEIR
ncbi:MULTISPECIES: hypothetical protein [unclassified Mycobacterium]|uniref:WXG100-like domain-containing protein n=1 Tax=unclassified Mycobacterium TaxID=2642494 RepID=UPI0007FCFB68|nr:MULTISPECIES: hypothetical protein [unclassified Mycobacterium]OBG62192.1 hypothetical protein A5703_21690 [Mycobacterium sp. E188]OBH34096.1 hypothetical protein A5691_08540 [Mycobacterium sp. E183]